MVDKFTVIELDRDLAERLRNHPDLAEKLTIHEGDAMRFDFTQLLKENNKLRIFGNLPYNISTPLIFHLLSFHEHVEDMHFMLQKEVVNRLAAGPGSKAYGRLTVMTQYYCRVMPVLEVPPESFKPAPKVDSAVVRLTPYETLPHPCTNLKWLDRVCREGFNQRRKTIRNCYKALLTGEQLEALDQPKYASGKPDARTVCRHGKLAGCKPHQVSLRSPVTLIKLPTGTPGR